MRENIANLKEAIIREIMADIQEYLATGYSYGTMEANIYDLVGALAGVAYLDGVRSAAEHLVTSPGDALEMASIDPVGEALDIIKSLTKGDGL